MILLLSVIVAAHVPGKVRQEIAVGAEVGMRAQPFSVDCYGGGTYDSEKHLGRVQVINFWATWCGPCVKELPHFDTLQKAYPDTVSVVAIHSDLVTEDVDKYLSGYDYEIPFALDRDGSVIASFNGAMMLPQTVVLDENGVIIYNQVGSLTYEKLEEIVLFGLEE